MFFLYIDLKQMQQYYGKEVTQRGMKLMCPLYGNEHRNFKLAGATMESRLGGSEGLEEANQLGL
jgi:hypothetical protein